MNEIFRSRRAVLVFARSLRMDLSKRKWPAWMAPALRVPFLDAPFDGADVHLFTSSCAAGEEHPGKVFAHAQAAGTFGVRLRAAIDELAALGYREVVIVGRDCPDLNPRDVKEAFAALGSHRLALGPDHKGGVYLIALRIVDRGLLEGVRWRRNTDRAQLILKAGPENVHLLAVKHDLDDAGDLLLWARRGSLRLAAVQRLLGRLRSRTSRRPAPRRPLEHRLRISWQLPPPETSR